MVMKCGVLCCFLFTFVVGGAEISFHTADVVAVVGDEASLSCGVERNRNNLFSNCSWVGPDREVVWAGGLEERRSVFVERDQKLYYCVLEISSLELADEGAWNCVIESEEGKDASNTKFIFVDIGGTDGPEILVKEGTVVVADEGEEASLLCPTSVRPRTDKERPTCIWFSPSGKKYDIIGRQGEIYLHEKEGISSAGNADRGDCGVTVERVQATHRGLWTCRIVTQYGQEVLVREKNVTLQVVPKKVKKPLNSGQVTFSLDIVKDQTDQIHNVYWILRRETLLTEGRTVCFQGRSKCVTSSNLEQMTVKDDRIYYQMKITYDDISQEDSEQPVVLVVEWRDENGADKSEHIFLEEVRSSSASQGSNMKALCGTDCKVDGARMSDGEVREDAQLCVVVRCDQGDVVLEKLNDCDKLEDDNDVVVFPDDFS